MFAGRSNFVCDELQPLFGRPVAANRLKGFSCQGILVDVVERIDEVLFARRQVADLEVHVELEGPVQNVGASLVLACGSEAH